MDVTNERHKHLKTTSKSPAKTLQLTAVGNSHLQLPPPTARLMTKLWMQHLVPTPTHHRESCHEQTALFSLCHSRQGDPLQACHHWLVRPRWGRTLRRTQHHSGSKQCHHESCSLNFKSRLYGFGSPLRMLHMHRRKSTRVAPFLRAAAPTSSADYNKSRAHLDLGRFGSWAPFVAM